MSDRKKTVKTIIIVLSVLLVLSISALGVTLLYRYTQPDKPTSVELPDNLITPDAENISHVSSTGEGENLPPASSNSGNSGTEPEGTGSNDPGDTQNTDTGDPEANSGRTYAGNTGGDTGNNTAGTTLPEARQKATALTLFKNNPEDSTPFQSENLFPGDRETRYYCVRVSHSDDVTVRYHADIRAGYEKLAEVLKCRIVLLGDNEVLYDGLMRDMPEELTHKLETDTQTESELFYEITVYLDTSVGNEYQDKNLVADFRWWVEETGSLEPTPTGDSTDLALWIGLAAASLLLIVLLVIFRRKEDKDK